MTYQLFCGLLLYSISTLLLHPAQEEYLTTISWKLQHIEIKNHLLQTAEPQLTGSDQIVWNFHKNGSYHSHGQRTNACGNWRLKGKTLLLEEEGQSSEFRISQLSLQALVLKTKTEEGCIRLRFSPIP